eukprot:SRR837773.12234.p1 GENE.SRR837773.12234~~SRR837773.12234.p1  ORF type:complete len:322 (+),score=75.10 SRR837773.12234:47-967(+)
MNLILAVIVEKAGDARERNVKEEAMRKTKEFEVASALLLRICQELDSSGSGSLSYDDLLSGYDEHEDFQDVMQAMDISRNDLEVVFHMLDVDRSGTIEYCEFVEQLHMMQSKEAHTLLVFLKFYVMDIRFQLEQLALKRQSESTSSAAEKELGSAIENSATKQPASVVKDKAHADIASATSPSTSMRLERPEVVPLDFTKLKQDIADCLREQTVAVEAHMRRFEVSLCSQKFATTPTLGHGDLGVAASPGLHLAAATSPQRLGPAAADGSPLDVVAAQPPSEQGAADCTAGHPFKAKCDDEPMMSV